MHVTSLWLRMWSQVKVGCDETENLLPSFTLAVFSCIDDICCLKIP